MEEKTSCRYIIDDDAEIQGGDFFEKLTLVIRMLSGDEREVDVSCDSEFMSEVMPDVGQAIRDAYHWVDFEHPIFCTSTMQEAMGQRKL